MEEVKSIKIGGKEHPVSINMAVQRYSLITYPQERLEKMTAIEAQDYTLDMVMQILTEPKPFNSIDDLVKALTPIEYKFIDSNIAFWLFAMEPKDDGEAPGK